MRIQIKRENIKDMDEIFSKTFKFNDKLDFDDLGILRVDGTKYGVEWVN